MKILVSISFLLLLSNCDANRKNPSSRSGSEHLASPYGSSAYGWRIPHTEAPNTDYEQIEEVVEENQLFEDNIDDGLQQSVVDDGLEDFDNLEFRPNMHYQTTTNPPVIPAFSQRNSWNTFPTPIPYRRDVMPEATCPVGKIRGKSVKLSTGKTVYAFLGIPYAKPPIGANRFKAPVPADNFTSVYDATKLPNSCVQESFGLFEGFQGEEIWNPNTNVSEDCLYLNIWVPEEVFNRRDDELVSVLFWIHGGGLFSGTSTLEVYEGAYLASQENVIVASTQYRLGPLGFLYFGCEEAPGNVGLWDQNMALQWVHKNVGGFGGNANSITLFGESAGSVSTAYHLLSPESKPYFKRVVMMSGVPTDTIYGVIPPNQLKQRSQKLAKLAGCNIRQGARDMIACLRTKDPLSLMKMSWQISSGKMLDFVFKPTVDGKFINDFPSKIIENGYAKRADLMIGSVEDEGSYFVLYQYLKYFHHDKPTSISRDRFIEIMKDIFVDFSSVEQQAIIHHYTNWENPEDGLVNQNKISEAVGDYFFTCPNRKFADTWANRGLNVFYYHFTHRSSTNVWAQWMGVMHGDDIEYILAHPLNDSKRFTEGEKQLATYFTRLLANFAKTGNPTENWERYTSEVPIYLDLNGTIPSDRTSERHGPHAIGCAFWNKFLPQLKKSAAITMSHPRRFNSPRPFPQRVHHNSPGMEDAIMETPNRHDSPCGGGEDLEPGFAFGQKPKRTEGQGLPRRTSVSPATPRQGCTRCCDDGQNELVDEANLDYVYYPSPPPV